ADGTVKGPGRPLSRGAAFELRYDLGRPTCARQKQTDFYVGGFVDERGHAKKVPLDRSIEAFVVGSAKVPNLEGGQELAVWVELHDIADQVLCFDSNQGQNYRFPVGK